MLEKMERLNCGYSKEKPSQKEYLQKLRHVQTTLPIESKKILMNEHNPQGKVAVRMQTKAVRKTERIETNNTEDSNGPKEEKLKKRDVTMKIDTHWNPSNIFNAKSHSSLKNDVSFEDMCVSSHSTEENPTKKPVTLKLNTRWDASDPVYESVKSNQKITHSRHVEGALMRIRNGQFEKSKDLQQSSVYVAEAKRIYPQGFKYVKGGFTSQTTKQDKSHPLKDEPQTNKTNDHETVGNGETDTEKKPIESTSLKRPARFRFNEKRTVTDVQKTSPIENPKPVSKRSGEGNMQRTIGIIQSGNTSFNRNDTRDSGKPILKEECMALTSEKMKHGYPQENNKLRDVRSTLRSEHKKTSKKGRNPQEKVEVKIQIGDVDINKTEDRNETNDEKPKRKYVTKELDNRWDPSDYVYGKLQSGFKSNQKIALSRQIEDELMKIRYEQFEKSQDLQQSSVYVMEAKRIYPQGFKYVEGGLSIPSTKQDKSQARKGKTGKTNDHDTVGNGEADTEKKTVKPTSPKGPGRFQFNKKRIHVAVVTDEQKDLVMTRNQKPRIAYPQFKKRSKYSATLGEKLANNIQTVASYQKYIIDKEELPKLFQKHVSSRTSPTKTTDDSTDPYKTTTSNFSTIRERTMDNDDGKIHRKLSDASSTLPYVANKESSESGGKGQSSVPRQSGKGEMLKAVNIVQSRKNFFNGKNMFAFLFQRIYSTFSRKKVVSTVQGKHYKTETA